MVRVIGPVVDVEFGRRLDAGDLFNALSVPIKLGDEDAKTLWLEVEQHIGDDMIRDDRARSRPTVWSAASEVTDSGGPITVPVGDVTKGHVFNVLGEPLDVDVTLAGAR